MPTVLTHPAVPLLIGIGAGRDAVPCRLLVAGALASALPDADVVGFALGIPYAADLGHRGFSHSLTFAALCAASGAALHRWLHTRAATAFSFLFAACASHPLLDAFTKGGLGVALLWPFTSERFFAPVRMIEVAPIRLARMISPRGAAVIASELAWVWLPCAAIALSIAWARRRGGARRRP